MIDGLRDKEHSLSPSRTGETVDDAQGIRRIGNPPRQRPARVDHACRPAFAQDTAPADPAQRAAGASDGDGEEIIVTATKRAETCRTCRSPSPRSHQDARRPAGRRLRRLCQPGPVAVVKAGGGGGSPGPGTNNVYFRGVASGENANHSTSLPSVGTYLDEQPITTIQGALDIHVFDIARIEALAGPQGTLYGASSQAGTIRIITNKPDLSGTYGEVEPGGEQGRARRLGLYGRRLRQPAGQPATSPPASSAGTAATAATSTISPANWRYNLRPDISSQPTGHVDLDNDPCRGRLQRRRHLWRARRAEDRPQRQLDGHAANHGPDAEGHGSFAEERGLGDLRPCSSTREAATTNGSRPR